MASTRDDRDLRRYLETLAGRAPASSLLELRVRVGEAMVAEFLPIHAHEAQAAAILDRASSTDVYVGCVPRVRRSGTKDAIGDVWVLWAECDGPEAARAAQAYSPRPPVVIGSGTGSNLHAYWPLREPVSPRTAEEGNLRLAHALRADRACFDAGRILRPPGTWNHKHAARRPVRALRLDVDRAFPFEHVVARCPEIDLSPLERRWRASPERNPGSDPLLRIRPRIYVAELLGVTPARNGKVRCPFHEDARPSLHVYGTAARGWSCFSCGRGGSIYDLAGALWGFKTRGREFLGLRQQLLDRFASEIALERDGLGR